MRLRWDRRASTKRPRSPADRYQTSTVGGYVCSEADPTDRRQRLLSPTEKGYAVARVNEAAYQLLAEDIRRRLTPEELTVYEQLTAKICGRIAELS